MPLPVPTSAMVMVMVTGGWGLGAGGWSARYWSLLHAIEQRHDQQFGFRAGNEDVRVDLEIERVKLAVADEVRDRCAGGAAFHQVTKCSADFFRRRFAEGGVEIDPPAAAGMGQQHFGVEPRVIGAVLPEVLDRPRQQAADGPGVFGSGHD